MHILYIKTKSINVTALCTLNSCYLDLKWLLRANVLISITEILWLHFKRLKETEPLHIFNNRLHNPSQKRERAINHQLHVRAEAAILKLEFPADVLGKPHEYNYNCNLYSLSHVLVRFCSALDNRNVSGIASCQQTLSLT